MPPVDGGHYDMIVIGVGSGGNGTAVRIVTCFTVDFV
jgi:pyruvate/2-oxoglutarate dehydrogenase complex dihydrolipoamide dehydrogenase (E3) component